MTRPVNAPTEIVWEVITDHDLYAKAAPNLTLVEVLEGQEEGMVRRCIDTNDNEWTEVCTHWSEEEMFAVAVDVNDSIFHRRFFTRFKGEWRIQERPNDVLITVQFEFEPKYEPFGIFISKFFERKAPGIIAPIFDRWEAEIGSRLSNELTAENQGASNQPITP
jgi:ribosome-associated toxin RatA of RatAB toxin-antitoxin module